MSSEQENPFEQVATKQILDVLQNAVATRSKLHIWTEGRKHQHVSRISKVANSESVTILTVPKEKKFEYILNSYAIEEVFMSVQLPNDLVYFKAKVRNSDEISFSFRLIEPLYKVQRRQAIRVPVPADMASAVEIVMEGRAEPIKAAILNISTGGVGVLTQELALEQEFEIGKKVSVSFQFGTLPVSATGNLRYLQVVQGSLISKRLKLGIQFDEIHMKTVDEIHTYVMHESTKYLGRKT
jgi:c-di-GMP-binding flagellar brake protein YcgR